MVRDFGEYSWRLCSLDKTLYCFNIHRNDESISVNNVKLPCNTFKNQKHSQIEYATGHCICRNDRSVDQFRCFED